jgi:hypothetical protein
MIFRMILHTLVLVRASNRLLAPFKKSPVHCGALHIALTLKVTQNPVFRQQQ